MGRPIKRSESSTIDSAYASGLGGTIGKPQSSSGVYTIAFTYKEADGTLIASGYADNQKGESQYLVGNSSDIGANITLVTLANPDGRNSANLSASEGMVTCFANASVEFLAKRISSKFVWDWDDNRYPYKVQTAADASYANVATA